MKKCPCKVLLRLCLLKPLRIPVWTYTFPWETESTSALQWGQAPPRTVLWEAFGSSNYSFCYFTSFTELFQQRGDLECGSTTEGKKKAPFAYLETTRRKGDVRVTGADTSPRTSRRDQVCSCCTVFCETALLHELFLRAAPDHPNGAPGIPPLLACRVSCRLGKGCSSIPLALSLWWKGLFFAQLPNFFLSWEQNKKQLGCASILL